MYIPGEFHIRVLGDSKSQADKQGYIALQQNGHDVLPLLSFWKTDKAGKPTALAQQLAKLEGDALDGVTMEGIDYVYSSSFSKEKNRWYNNHALVSVNKLINRGQDAVDDDSVLPHTSEEPQQTV